MTETYDELKAALGQLYASGYEPTQRQWEEQAMSFTYGNLAIDELVSRSAFENLIRDKYLWTTEEIEAWLNARKWDLP